MKLSFLALSDLNKPCTQTLIFHQPFFFFGLFFCNKNNRKGTTSRVCLVFTRHRDVFFSLSQNIHKFEVAIFRELQIYTN